MPENARNPESTDPEGSAAAGDAAAAGPAPPDDGAAEPASTPGHDS